MSIFDEAYSGVPNWEIGRPQREFVTLEETGEIRGDVLDVGCGTGENALFLAERGHKVWGVDSVPRAIELAREKARERDLPVTFLVQDALDMENLSRTFDTIIDSGLFHALSDPDRLRFVRSLAAVLRPGTWPGCRRSPVIDPPCDSTWPSPSTRQPSSRPYRPLMK